MNISFAHIGFHAHLVKSKRIEVGPLIDDFRGRHTGTVTSLRLDPDHHRMLPIVEKLSVFLLFSINSTIFKVHTFFKY